MGTGIGVTRPPATDCREPPEVGEARKDPSQETSEGEGPADTPISHCQPAELGGGAGLCVFRRLAAPGNRRSLPPAGPLPGFLRCARPPGALRAQTPVHLTWACSPGRSLGPCSSALLQLGRLAPSVWLAGLEVLGAPRPRGPGAGELGGVGTTWERRGRGPVHVTEDGIGYLGEPRMGAGTGRRKQSSGPGGRSQLPCTRWPLR